jgi:hypothetical protein
MTEPLCDSGRSLPRNDSCDAVDLIVDGPGNPNPRPDTPAEKRYMEDLRERYLRGLAFREAQQRAAEGQDPKPEG